MSSQLTFNKKSESSSPPPQSSQAASKISTSIKSLPLEVVGLITEEVMKNEENTNTTRSHPAFIRSLKSDDGQPWRDAYLYALETCNKGFVYSLHFANDWKLLVEGEERQVIQNVVVKYMPGQAISSKQAAELEDKESVGQLSVAEAALYYSAAPLPEDLNRSLNDLPKLRTVRMEFKTFLATFKNTYRGMYRVLQAFLDDHEDFKLTEAVIEPRSNTKFTRLPNKPAWKIEGQEIERLVIPAMSQIVGRNICFLLQDNNTWKLVDDNRRRIPADEFGNLNLDDVTTRSLAFHVGRVLSFCTWTFTCEKEQ